MRRTSLHAPFSLTQSQTIRRRALQSRGIEAIIDWSVIESAQVLTDLPPTAITLVEREVTNKATGGTTITLKGIRRRWTPRDLVRFVTEAHATRPPPLLVESLPESVLAEPLLFMKPVVETPHKGASDDPGWQLELSGDFDVGEHYWRALAAQAAWVLEIDATQSS